MAWKESRFDPAARNPLSSARGLMQFTDATWLESVRDFGPRHGLARHAAALSTDHRDGTISTRDPRHLARLLKLRGDPRLSALMAAERISRRAGRPGAGARARGGAGRPLRRCTCSARRGRGASWPSCGAPLAPGARAVGRDSVAANRGVFLARGNGRPLSLAEVHAAMAGAVEEQRTARAGLLARLTAPSADRADRRGAPGADWVEMAEAR
jgi:hypothetical protein